MLRVLEMAQEEGPDLDLLRSRQRCVPRSDSLLSSPLMQAHDCEVVDRCCCYCGRKGRTLQAFQRPMAAQFGLLLQYENCMYILAVSLSCIDHKGEPDYI